MPTLSLTVPLCATCCDPCAHTGSINLTAADFVACPCQASGGFPASFHAAIMSGLNGLSAIPFDSAAFWRNPDIGRVNNYAYDDAFCTVNETLFNELYVTAEILCVDGEFTVDLWLGPAPGVESYHFFSGTGALGEAIANTIPCTAFVGEGTVTLALA